jgi:hypothetical protein
MREALILRFLDTLIFGPVLAAHDAPADVRRGVRFTRMCINRLPADSMIRYFWSAIEGTGRSEHFSERMRIAGFATFEDILGQAREFFRSLGGIT